MLGRMGYKSEEERACKRHVRLLVCELDGLEPLLAKTEKTECILDVLGLRC